MTVVSPANPTESTSDSVVTLSDVQLQLASEAGNVNILRGIDVKIPAGQIVGLVGPSGAGKTSLMMVMAGLERSATGSIKISGTEITDFDEDRLAEFRRDNVGIVFQDFHLVPTMTAQENVAIPLEFAGINNPFEQAADMLKRVGLEHRLTHYPTQLSGGEQQRVALARALVSKPSVLLADEPTGNLDGQTGEKVIELMFELTRAEGGTLILITHDPDLAERCDRVIRVEDGQIAEDRLKAAEVSRDAVGA